MSVYELRHPQIAELYERLQEIHDGKDEELIERCKQLGRTADDELEQIDIQHQLEIDRIERIYKRKMEENKKELDAKLKEAKESMLRELDEQERQIELEYNSVEIGRMPTAVCDSGKKTLRGHGGVLIEPRTYFNATPKPQVPAIIPNTTYLLSDAKIAADVRQFDEWCNQGKSQDTKQQRLYDVTLVKHKLTYDGKTYKQGEEVMVEASFGKFPAKIEQISESVVSFKATQSWDVRQIHANFSDLMEGRVFLTKKKGNS